MVKLGLRSFIRTRFVVLIVGTLIVRSVTPRRSRTPSRSRSDSAWSASLQGASYLYIEELYIYIEELILILILIMDSTIYKERNDRPANEKDSAYLATFSSNSRRARCAARGLWSWSCASMKSPLRSSWVYA